MTKEQIKETENFQNRLKILNQKASDALYDFYKSEYELYLVICERVGGDNKTEPSPLLSKEEFLKSIPYDHSNKWYIAATALANYISNQELI